MRGMVAGEPIVSQAQTREFDEGYERTFGPKPDGKAKGGKWVMTDHGLVPINEYVPENRALDAPIMVDRFMEGHEFDGADIGSRRKRREFMKRNNLEDANDASPEWKASLRASNEREQDRRRHEHFEQAKRVLYQQGKFGR